MENPFRYGEVVGGEYFADREDEVDGLVRDLSRGQNVILFSPRRYGKTSLIFKVMEILQGKGVVCIYIDLYRVTSLEKFITVYAKAIGSSLSGKVRELSRKLSALLPRLISKVVLKGGDFIEFEFSFDRVGDKEPILDDLLEAAQRYSSKYKKKVTVIFDEFQEIALWDKGELERELRSHFQLHPDVAYVFMCSKKHLMLDIFANKNRSFYRFGKHIPLGKIPSQEFSLFIKRWFEKGGYRILPEAIDLILQSTENHPYFTQLFCNILWDKEAESKKITPLEVKNSLWKILKRESHAYNEIWDRLSIKSRKLLEALTVESQARLYSADFINRYNLGAISTLRGVVNRLENSEIIEKENNSYIFTDIFFKNWIKENIL